MRRQNSTPRLRRPVLLPSTSPLDTNWSALVAGSVKGGAGVSRWVQLPAFPVFVRLVLHHHPEGTAPHRLHPPPLARIDKFINTPGSDWMPGLGLD